MPKTQNQESTPSRLEIWSPPSLKLLGRMNQAEGKTALSHTENQNPTGGPYTSPWTTAHKFGTPGYS